MKATLALFIGAAAIVGILATSDKASTVPPSALSDVVAPVDDSFCASVDVFKMTGKNATAGDGTCTSTSCQTCANFCGQHGLQYYCCDGEDDPTPGEVYCCCSASAGPCARPCTQNDCPHDL
mmetsp:Transcript_35336/g.106497  ORF Transcript_35336/g.106497 Transcript_35336/m.106497 type:complete len:122 (+) Transcript_35336:32-397(+)